MSKSVNKHKKKAMKSKSNIPQINIALPVALLLGRGDIGYSPLINLPDPFLIPHTFLQPYVVKPGIIIQRILLHFVLILKPSLPNDGILYPFPVPILFLKCHKFSIQIFRPSLWNMIQSKLIDSSCTLSLLTPFLKLRKSNK